MIVSGQGGVDGTRGGYGGDLMLNIGERERIVSRMNFDNGHGPCSHVFLVLNNPVSI